MGKSVVTRSNHHPLPHDHAIRSKLLNRLGIYKTVPVRNSVERRKHVIRSLSAPLSSHPSLHHKRANVLTFRLPLNDSNDSSSTPSHPPLSFMPVPISPPSSSNSSLATSHERTIQFQDEVLVLPIPSRHDYSERIKKFLWSGAEELSETIERNRAEFASEGWDWHSVLEDDEMYVDAKSGELVHPIWLEEEEHDTMMMDALVESLPTLSRSPSCATNLQQLSE